MSKAGGAPGERQLTSRQLECLELYSRRKSAKEIGDQLGISQAAVQKHLTYCREKLGVTTSIEAARIVFGEKGKANVRPHYDASEILGGRAGSEALSTPAHGNNDLYYHSPHLVNASSFDEGGLTPTARDMLGGVAGERALINQFGALTTLALILAVAAVAICIMAVVVEAGEGIIDLGRSMGY